MENIWYSITTKRSQKDSRLCLFGEQRSRVLKNDKLDNANTYLVYKLLYYILK